MSERDPPLPPHPALVGIDRIFEDNHLLALHKPAGLLTQAARAGDDTLLERARSYLREAYDKPGNVYVGLVHRLDRNVGGVVLLARTSKAASRLAEAFRTRRVDKRYLAVVEGDARERGYLVHTLAPRGSERGVVVDPGGKRAELRYELLAAARGRSVLEVELLTGRKHQIRAQLAAAGLPIVGDPLYGRWDDQLRRPALHAWGLALDHPIGGRGRLELVAAIPPDLDARLSAFRPIPTAPRFARGAPQGAP